MHALVVGGTRFIGRHAVEDFLDHGYAVTLFNRGRHENPFADHDQVEHVEGDRKDDAALEAAADAVEPDVVIDCVAYQPRDVRAATGIFADAEAYVYVSSGAAYARDEDLPLREGEAALQACTDAQARDGSPDTYGPRKAEGDRAVFEAAREGVNAVSVRPCFVYGPHDYTERFDYWIDRVATDDRVLVPGDGDYVAHRVYVEDVASALRIAAERGEPGEAYNVADRRFATTDRTLSLIADALGTEVEPVHASERDLAAAGLDPEDFPLRYPFPYVMDTAKLADLGWESTPLPESHARTVEEHLASDRDGRDRGPDPEATERVVEAIREQTV